MTPTFVTHLCKLSGVETLTQQEDGHEAAHKPENMTGLRTSNPKMTNVFLSCMVGSQAVNRQNLDQCPWADSRTIA